MGKKNYKNQQSCKNYWRYRYGHIFTGCTDTYYDRQYLWGCVLHAFCCIGNFADFSI